MADEPKTEPTPEAAEKKFTQKQLDDMVESRLERDRRTRGNAEAELVELKRDYEDARKQIAELQKAASSATKYAKDLEAAQQALADEKSARTKDRASLEIKTALENAGATKGAQPLILSMLLAQAEIADEDGKLKINHNGKPLDEAVKAMLADNPDLAVDRGGVGSGAGKATAPGTQFDPLAAWQSDPAGFRAKLNSDPDAKAAALKAAGYVPQGEKADITF